MHFLVTGGAGFIGRHLCRALVFGGNTVTVLDSLCEPALYKQENIAHLCRLPQLTFIEADILDAAACRAAAKGADGVFHLAALAGVGASVDAPAAYERVNVQGTAMLLSVLGDDPRPVVFASSSSVYGDAENTETAAPLPLSPYARTKLTAERLLQLYCAANHAGGAACRLFSVCGPGMRPDLALPLFASAMCRSEPICIFGSCRRDYTHVQDTVRGLLLAMEWAQGGGYGVFNLGCGKSTGTAELIALLERHMGRTARCRLLPKRPFDPLCTCADTKKAQEVLHFTAQLTAKDAVADFVRWFLD